MHNKVKNKSAGFTLVEMAIVLIIVGLLIAAGLPGLQVYNNKKNFEKTQENMRLAQEALREFYGLNGRYPCPADPTLAPGDEDYGEEVCRADIADACPSGLFCTDVGSRDANNDGAPDPVLIGTLPSKTIADNALFAKFKLANGQDAFLMKLTYAVSELMTDQVYNISNPANIQLGAIALKDEFERDLLDPPDSAHYIILSHGDNSRGAFSTDGADIGDCTIVTGATPTPPPAGSNIGASGIELEKENCDRNDAIFVKALRSMADNDSYFDDTLFFNATVASSLWRRSNFSPPTDAYLYNTNLGDVGIGVTDPTNKLEINGDIKTETSIIADGRYCAPDATDCVAPEALGGSAMTPCPAGQIATGIENNDLICAPLFTGPISFSCPISGQFVTGFSNQGNVNCAFPP